MPSLALLMGVSRDRDLGRVDVLLNSARCKTLSIVLEIRGHVRSIGQARRGKVPAFWFRVGWQNDSSAPGDLTACPIGPQRHLAVGEGAGVSFP